MSIARSQRATDNVRRADEALVKQRRDHGLHFGSPAKALGWYFENRERMQSAKGMHPRTVPQTYRGGDGELRATGEAIPVPRVDGGGGSMLDDIYAALHDIGAALELCRHDYPVGTEALILQVRDGKSQRWIADTHRLSQSQVSIETGKATAFLASQFRTAEIL